MSGIALNIANIRKVFQRRTILSGVNVSLAHLQSLAITGRNGSGKSTLIKIIAGLLSPTAGEVTVSDKGATISRDERYSYIGFVAPYLQLYDEFSGWENLDLARKLRCLPIADDVLTNLLERVNLAPRKDDLVRTYSSGMKQRLKYAHALLHRPPILLLDEPTSNLDTEGMKIVYELIAEQRKHGIVIVATNVKEELSWCEYLLDLDAASVGSAVKS